MVPAQRSSEAVGIVLPLGWEDPLEEGMATHSRAGGKFLRKQKNARLCKAGLMLQ